MFHIIQSKKFLTGVMVVATVLQLLPFGAFAQIAAPKAPSIPVPMPVSAPAPTAEHPAATQPTSQPFGGGSIAQPTPPAATDKNTTGTQGNGGSRVGSRKIYNVSAALIQSLIAALNALPGLVKLSNIKNNEGDVIATVSAMKNKVNVQLVNDLVLGRVPTFTSTGFFAKSASCDTTSAHSFVCSLLEPGTVSFKAITPPSGPGDKSPSSGVSTPPTAADFARESAIALEIEKEMWVIFRDPSRESVFPAEPPMIPFATFPEQDAKAWGGARMVTISISDVLTKPNTLQADINREVNELRDAINARQEDVSIKLRLKAQKALNRLRDELIAVAKEVDDLVKDIKSLAANIVDGKDEDNNKKEKDVSLRKLGHLGSGYANLKIGLDGLRRGIATMTDDASRGVDIIDALLTLPGRLVDHAFQSWGGRED